MNLQEAIARAENGDIHVHAEPGLRILLWEWPGNDSEEVLRLRQKCLGKILSTVVKEDLHGIFR